MIDYIFLFGCLKLAHSVLLFPSWQLQRYSQPANHDSVWIEARPVFACVGGCIHTNTDGLRAYRGGTTVDFSHSKVAIVPFPE